MIDSGSSRSRLLVTAGQPVRAPVSPIAPAPRRSLRGMGSEHGESRSRCSQRPPVGDGGPFATSAGVEPWIRPKITNISTGVLIVEAPKKMAIDVSFPTVQTTPRGFDWLTF